MAGLFLSLAFGIGMIVPLWSADLYLWYDWLDMKWFGCLCCCFQERKIPSAKTANFGLRVRESQQRSHAHSHLQVGVIHQWTGEVSRVLSGGNNHHQFGSIVSEWGGTISGEANLVGL